MNVYRDDLAAARERIRSLEGELQSLQRREASSIRRANREDLARAGSSHGPTAAALVGAVVVGFVALRVPVLAPVAIVAVLFALFVLVVRGRSIVVLPNEVAVLHSKRVDPLEPSAWIGPGRVARLKRSVTAESLSMRASPVSWTANGVSTADEYLDIDLFAVVAVRRDEEGIERAVHTFGAGPITPISQAAIEDALRQCAKDTPAMAFRQRDAGLRDRLRRLGRESLDELGVKLLMVGVIDSRSSSKRVGP